MTEPSSDPAGGRPALRRLLPLLFLLAGLLAFFAFGGQRYLDFETLEEHREALLALVAEHGFVAALAFTAAYAVMVTFSVPGALVMTVASGFLFGTLGGAACSVVGATLGSIAVFLAARTALGELFRNRAAPALNKMRTGFQEDALSYLLVLRLVPLFPFWLVNLVPALLGVSLRVFMVGTFFGIIPGSLVYASVGNGLGAIFEAGETEGIKDAILEPEVLLPIAGLIILSLVPVLYKKTLHRKVNARKRGDSGKA